MDVYVDRPRHKVWLIDFNPFSPTTDGLLFDWTELIECKLLSTPIQSLFYSSCNIVHPLNPEFEPEFRIIESVVDSRVCNAPRFATNMVPKDVIDLSDGRTVAEFAEEFERAMKLAGQEQDSSSSSSDDDDDEKQR